jgi:hypothetical protein
VSISSTPFDDYVLQMHLLKQEECRFMDDGIDGEYLYCQVDETGSYCPTIELMQSQCNFISRDCPDCNQKYSKDVNKK